MTPEFQPQVMASHLALAHLLRDEHAAGPFVNHFSMERLCQVHRSLFAGTEEDFHAGRLRTLTVHAGTLDFPLAREVGPLLMRTFANGLPHWFCVVDWAAYVLMYIHPFLNGNRRACWQFANDCLAGQGFRPIDWEGFRPFWEHVLLLPHDEKMAVLLPELVRYHRDILPGKREPASAPAASPALSCGLKT